MPRLKTKSDLVRAIRHDLALEHEAAAQYTEHADDTDHPLAKAVLNSIAGEERVHAGEFRRLLHVLNGDEDTLDGKGREEVDSLMAQIGQLEEVVNQVEEAAEGEPIPGQSVKDWVNIIEGTPGVVVDPDLARATPCIRIEMEKDAHKVYSKGIIGALDEEEQALYCQGGFEDRALTEAQRDRMSTMQEAAGECKRQMEEKQPQDRVGSFFGCLGEELRNKGHEGW